MGAENLILHELREVNKNLSKILNRIEIISENQKKHDMQITFLRSEMYSYFRKLQPEENKGGQNND